MKQARTLRTSVSERPDAFVHFILKSFEDRYDVPSPHIDEATYDSYSMTPLCNVFSPANMNNNLFGPYPFEPCQEFLPTPTTNGICAGFNVNPQPSRMLQESSFLREFQASFESDILKPEKARHLRFSSHGSGDFTFFINRQRLFSTLAESYDRRVREYSVSLNNHLDSFNLDGVVVKPKFLTVTPVQLSAAEDVKSVRPESRKCLFPDEAPDESMFTTYTQNLCLWECRLAKARDTCGCTPWDFPYPNSADHPPGSASRPVRPGCAHASRARDHRRAGSDPSTCGIRASS